LGKRRNYEEAFSTEEEQVNSEHGGHDSSKKYKFDHDFSPELAFEIELEAMTRGFAKLNIDYPAGATKCQKVVRKVTRYRAGGRREAGGVAFVNGMAYKSPRA
jgi:hypothetical protein